MMKCSIFLSSNLSTLKVFVYNVRAILPLYLPTIYYEYQGGIQLYSKLIVNFPYNTISQVISYTINFHI